MNSSTTILFTPPSSPSYSTLSFSHKQQQQPSSHQQQLPATKTLFHNPISIPQQQQQHKTIHHQHASFNINTSSTLSTPPMNSLSSSNKKPNRHSLPKASNIWQQHQQQMQEQQQQQQQLQNYQKQQQQGMLASPPPSPLSLDTRRAGLPRLSLDTSQECLSQKSPTIIQHGDQSYLKLFSPTLVDSPVSYLDEKQQIADNKMWENGPDEAFQKQLVMERRDALKARSRQQLRGFLLGLWLGFLMGLLVLQQTSAK
ncbi:hypothetical protein BGX30_005383, partial [Mortierella sp. GBA39]